MSLINLFRKLWRITMKMKLYNFLVNKQEAIAQKYHAYHDRKGRFGKILSWVYLIYLNVRFYIFHIEEKVPDIISSRESYSSFKAKERYEKNVFWELKEQQTVQENALLVYCQKIEVIRQLIKKAKEEHIKVYVPKQFRKELGDTEEILFFEKNTDDFFKLLWSVHYVYTDRIPHPYFYARKAQIFIADISLYDKSRLKERINADMLSAQADYVIRDYRTEIISSFSSIGKSVEKKTPEKEKILFIINTKYFQAIYNFLLLFWGNIDKNLYDLSILAAEDDINQFEQKLLLLDEKIHIFAKRKKVFCNSNTASALAFANKEKDYLENIQQVENYVGKDALLAERSRIFGNWKFDYIINAKHESMYWKLLIKGMDGTKIYWDINGGLLKDKNKIKNRMGQAVEIYHKVLFSDVALVQYLQNTEWSQLVKSGTVDLIPSVTFQEQEFVSNLYYANTENGRVVLNQFLQNEDGSINAVFVEGSQRSCVFLKISPQMRQSDVMDVINNQLMHDNYVIIFDYLMRMNKGKMKMKNVVYITDYIQYSMLCKCMRINSEIDTAKEKKMVMLSGEKNSTGVLSAKILEFETGKKYLFIPWNMNREQFWKIVESQQEDFFIFDIYCILSVDDRNCLKEKAEVIQILDDYNTYIEMKPYLGESVYIRNGMVLNQLLMEAV